MRLKDWVTAFSGEDITILRRCERAFQNRFAFVGLFVIFIYLGCFVSCYYAIYSFFGHSLLISLTIGLFFSWMITNIYLLLLYTLTPNLIIDKDPSLAMFSLLIRILFIIFLSIIISRPISVLLFDYKLESNVEQKKKEMLVEHKLLIDSLLISREKEILFDYQTNLKLRGLDLNQYDPFVRKVVADTVTWNTIKGHSGISPKESISNSESLFQLEQLFTLFVTSNHSDSSFLISQQELNAENKDSLYRSFSDRINVTLQQKIESHHDLSTLLDNNSFFIYKARAVPFLYPFSVLIDVGIIIIFLLPVYWKYRERKLTRYYTKRKIIEKQIVLDEYETFKVNYSKALRRFVDRDIQFYEPYEDPPFNTVRKSRKEQFKSQEDLLQKLYALD